MNTEERASAMEKEISSPGSCHDPELRPFLEITSALTREAESADSRLDPGVAKTQRAFLMSRANELKTAAEETTPEESARSRTVPPMRPLKNHLKLTPPGESLGVRFGRVFGAWKRSLAPVAVVALILLLVLSPLLPYIQQKSPSKSIVSNVAELIIPAANAADAFTFTANSRDASGVDPSSAFKIETKVDVSANDIEQHLALVKTGAGSDPVAVDFNVKKTGDHAFNIIPDEPLDPGSVYKANIKTTLLDDSGEKTARTFTWALQTKDAFRVLSTVPGPNANNVPVNTGIEFTVNMTGWSDATSSFSITPAVAGRFETHGRSLAFVPEKPLAYGTVYTVTMSKNWKITDTDRALEKDVTIQFETERKPSSSDGKIKLSVEPVDHHATIIPGKPAKIYVYTSGGIATTTVTGFRLNPDQAKAYLENEMRVPFFANVTLESGKIQEPYAKAQAFEFSDVPRGNGDAQWSYVPRVLDIPTDIPEGKYLVRLTSKDGLQSWFYLECTNVAAYLMSTKDRTLIWAVDASANAPIKNISVQAGDEQTATDEQGLAYIKTPDTITSTTTREGVVLMIGEGMRSAYVPLAPGSAAPYGYGWGWGMQTDPKTVSFLHTDRPLYHPTDEAKLSGVVQERNGNGAPSGSFWVELRKNDYFDYFWRLSRSKTYKKVFVTPDAQGFFTASLNWENLASSAYRLVLVHDGTDLFSQDVSIRTFTKPAYSMSTTSDKPAYFNGEHVRLTANAAFFDGTPVPDLEFQTAYFNAGSEQQKTQTTDDNGEAAFDYTANARPCTSLAEDDYCTQENWQYIEAHPTKGEEGGIQSTQSFSVWNSHISIDSRTMTDKDTATIAYAIRNVTLQPSRDAEAIPRERWPAAGGKQISGTVYENWWEGVPAGTGYDAIEKKTYPIIRYERRTASIATFALTTDSLGNATTTFKMKSDRFYTVVASAKDDAGSLSVDRAFAMENPYFSQTPSSEPGQSDTIQFERTNRPDNRNAIDSYKIGDLVSYGFFKKGELLPSQPAKTYLYVQTMNGILNASASNLSKDEFTFSEQLVPNMTLWGVLFTNGGFQEFSASCVFDTASRNAKIAITTDQKSYAPGGTAHASAVVTDDSGKPLANARVVFDVVDEALYATTYVWTTDDPKLGLYRWVDNGVLTTHMSMENKDMAPAAMAERGGGGGGDTSVRTNFKDTAAYVVAMTDANGKATADVSLPDNITSWRMTAIATTPDRYAGYETAKVPVTKPVFVTAVIPPRLTSSDRMQIKLRAYGAALKPGTEVEFTVDAPAAGITNKTIKGKAYDSAYLPVDPLQPGTYPVTIRVKSSAGNDAFLKRVTVIDSIFTRTEAVRLDAAPGQPLGDIGNAPEVDVRFIPTTRAQYIGDLQRLTWTGSSRVEAKLGSTIANDLLNTYFGDLPHEDASGSHAVLTSYQTYDGGIALVPYGGSDPEVSSKIALIAPEYFDRAALASYFGQMLSTGNPAREAQIRALAGLAALGEPALIDLQHVAAQSDLTWRETLAAAAGLVSAGDTDTAKILFGNILKKGEQQDDRMMIRVSDKEAENIEATAEASRIAEVLADPSAKSLRVWIRHNWNKDAFTVLDRIGFLRIAVPNAIGRDVTITYNVGGGNQTVNLVNGRAKTVTLTAEEAKAFQIVSNNAPAAIAFNRPTSEPVTPSKDLTLTRTYTNAKGDAADHFKEGEVVTVKLHVAFKDTAPDGCYELRDYLPAGLAPFSLFTGFLNDEDAPSFFVCKDNQHPSTDLDYTARIIAKGTYRAEPAVLQHEETPSVGIMTDQKVITIE